jgi:tetrahydromethanopterin S-methyltransferase subunit G
MTRSQVDAIIDRLDAQSAKIDRLQSEIDQMKGGLTVLKALGALLGVGGIGTLLAWLQSQSGK